MAKAKLSKYENVDRLRFFCPGCNETHVVTVGGNQTWQWNGSVDRPTLTPSVFIRSGHYAPHATSEDCWCTYNANHPDEKAPFVCTVCHSFVLDGYIQFLSDCTHHLSGQTVELPELKEGES